MPLHPQAQMVCDLANSTPRQEYNDERLDEARQSFAMIMRMGGGTPEEMHTIEDRVVPGPAGDIPIRIYRPTADDGLPVVVHLHGGGWTIGCVDDYDIVSRSFAGASGAIVVAVDYRLAPEHPFPAAVEDSWAALQWVAANAESFGGDASRLAVAGDSAGGNLSAVLALMARDAGAPELALQVLVYPVTDYAIESDSYAQNGTGYLLELERMVWFFGNYARGGALELADWRVAPARAASLAGVAPAVVITAEFDPLRDEGEAYAAALAAAGVPVEAKRYAGQIHLFAALLGLMDDAQDARLLVGTALRRAFGTEG